jgi:hypothetical protein
MPQPLDLDRLAKLMEVTTSGHDGEALNALRAANRLLSQAGETWSGVLGSAPAPAGAIIADQCIEGMLPPYGRTWRETVRYLMEVNAAKLNLLEAQLLDDAAVYLAGQDHKPPLLTVRSAARFTRLYETFINKEKNA